MSTALRGCRGAGQRGSITSAFQTRGGEGPYPCSLTGLQLVLLASGSVFPCVPHEDLNSLAAPRELGGLPMLSEAPSSLMILQALKLSAHLCPPESWYQSPPGSLAQVLGEILTESSEILSLVAPPPPAFLLSGSQQVRASWRSPRGLVRLRGLSAGPRLRASWKP